MAKTKQTKKKSKDQRKDIRKLVKISLKSPQSRLELWLEQQLLTFQSPALLNHMTLVLTMKDKSLTYSLLPFPFPLPQVGARN